MVICFTDLELVENICVHALAQQLILHLSSYHHFEVDFILAFKISTNSSCFREVGYFTDLNVMGFL